MIEITPSLSIDENEIQLDFIRSSGPGGQNVNKVATGVQLRFDLNTSGSLPDEVKQRLRQIARNRISDQGVLIIEGRRFRTQEQNRADVLARLVTLVIQAAEAPRTRKPTHPSASARAKRITEKRRHGMIKQLRRSAPNGDE